MADFHVVLKRVYNVIVDHVQAESEEDAIKQAELRCDKLERHLSGITVAQNVILDDGEEPTAALVDTYDEDGSYKEESYFEYDGNHDRYVKKP